MRVWRFSPKRGPRPGADLLFKGPGPQGARPPKLKAFWKTFAGKVAFEAKAKATK